DAPLTSVRQRGLGAPYGLPRTTNYLCRCCCPCELCVAASGTERVRQEKRLMLVLTRQLGERIVIADSIVVTIVDIARGKVRLGVEAPAEVRVVRQELLTRSSGWSAEQPPAGPRRK